METLNIQVEDTVVMGKTMKSTAWTTEYVIDCSSGETSVLRMVCNPNEMSLPPTFYSRVYFPMPVA